MIKKTIVFMLIFVSLAVSKEFRLNPNYRVKHQSPQAKNILLDYERFVNSIQHRTKYDKLNLVNAYLNGLRTRFDADNGYVDYWSSRGEFLAHGGGDCEDYAIAKYYTLKDLGIKSKDMCLLIVKEKYSRAYHMVLGVWTGKSREPKILDNLSFKVLPFSQRTDLRANYCLNESGSYKIKKNGKRTRANIRFKSYEDMLRRQKRERIWKR